MNASFRNAPRTSPLHPLHYSTAPCGFRAVHGSFPKLLVSDILGPVASYTGRVTSLNIAIPRQGRKRHGCHQHVFAISPLSISDTRGQKIYRIDLVKGVDEDLGVRQMFIRLAFNLYALLCDGPFVKTLNENDAIDMYMGDAGGQLLRLCLTPFEGMRVAPNVPSGYMTFVLANHGMPCHISTT